LSSVTAIAGGDNHSLAVKDDGTVWTWGLNKNGQLGDGTTADRDNPVSVLGLPTGVQVLTLLVRGRGTVIVPASAARRNAGSSARRERRSS